MASSDPASQPADSSSPSASPASNGAAAPIPRSLADPRKVALVTGITGQDGSYLTEFLLAKGFEVHGLIRRSSNFNTARLDHLYVDPHNSAKARMKLHYADLSDASSLRRWVDTLLPDEVYNLAAQSHVAVSFEIPDYTADVVATGSLRLLDAVRSAAAAHDKQFRYYQAGSSEMFGSTPPPQSETTPFHPRSPYAAAKAAAHCLSAMGFKFCSLGFGFLGCDLEVLDLNSVREATDTCSVFGHCAKIQIREVFAAGGDGVENLCGLFVLRASPVAGKGHLAGDLCMEKMVELLSVNKSETEGKSVWQLILSFLYSRNYWALVTVSGSDGSKHMGILKPFMINHAVLCFAGKDFIGSCGGTDVSVAVKSKGGGRSRSKIKDVSWSSFCEAAFERFDGDGCGVDLEDVYFAREGSKTKKFWFLKCWMKQIESSSSSRQIKPEEKKFRFLKCWMKQIESSSSSRQIKPEELDMSLSVKEEEEWVLDSPPELEEQLSLSSYFSGGSHLSGSMSEDVASFDCLDDPEAFLVSIPQKIETGLWSEEADLRKQI